MIIQLDQSCPFNLDFTLCCGQSFRWYKLGDWWYGVVGENVFKIRQFNEKIEFEGIEESFVRHYFGLYDNLQEILSQIVKDKHMKNVAEKVEGLRILRQDPWECLISYICATYKNIPAIKQMISNLAKKYGQRIVFDRKEFYTFPTPEKLAKATLKELTECGLGFRAKYVLETAKKVHQNYVNLSFLREKDYEEVMRELQTFLGVGLKVADCVALFSLEKMEAFPIDVWVKRALLKHYGRFFPKEFIEKISEKKGSSNSEYKKMSSFARKYFGKYAGYAQEYLYHYERSSL